MTCLEIEPLLTRFVLGDLDDAQRAQVEAHLRTCARCEALEQSTRTTLDLLRSGLADSSTARISLSAAQRRGVILRTRRASTRSSSWIFQRHPALSAAAAAVLVAGFFFALITPAFMKARSRFTPFAVMKLGEIVDSVGDKIEVEARFVEVANHDLENADLDYVAGVRVTASDADGDGLEDYESGRGWTDESKDKVPVLGDVPVSGRLFRGTAADPAPDPAATVTVAGEPGEINGIDGTVTYRYDDRQKGRDRDRRPATPPPPAAKPKPAPFKLSLGTGLSDADLSGGAGQIRNNDMNWSLQLSAENGRTKKLPDHAARRPEPAPKADISTIRKESGERFSDEKKTSYGSYLRVERPEKATETLVANSLERREGGKKANVSDSRRRSGTTYAEAEVTITEMPPQSNEPETRQKQVADGEAAKKEHGFGLGYHMRAESASRTPAQPDASLPMGQAGAGSGAGSGGDDSFETEPLIANGYALQTVGGGLVTLEGASSVFYDQSEVLREVGGDAPVDGARGLKVVEEKTDGEETGEEEETESRFKAWGVNPFVLVSDEAFSTFGIDVDTASYTLSRNYMLRGYLPPAESVRTEEFVNFFDYGYPSPRAETFKVYTETAPSKFGRGLHLLKIGVKGRRLGREEQRPAILTFLVDTSGSMGQSDRIGLVKKSLKLLVERLADEDRVAIVQYGNRARLVLEHTPGAQKKQILAAVERLQCSGSTNLEEGMKRAYEVAARNFLPGGENRVLLLSDGVANLGTMTADEILQEVSAYRDQGILCSVFGFGMGTYDDTMLEALANQGDGAYTFVDSEEEARRVFVDDLAATLNTIATDVKIQVEFNGKTVTRYRQLGYENRQLTKEQFRDDTVDAGEVGSGQTVTALYELALGGRRTEDGRRRMEDRGQKTASGRHGFGESLAVVRVRYRRLDTGKVEEIEHRVRLRDVRPRFEDASRGFQLAAGVAEFAEILRGSPFAAGSDYDDVRRVLQPAALSLPLDARVQELLGMVQQADGMARGE